MKKTLLTLTALLVCGAVIAGQLATTWDLRNVVDPPDLRDGLNADAQAADARIDALESGTTIGDKTFNGNLTVVSNIVNSALTASKPVFTDVSKGLVSTGTLAADQGGTGAATLTDGGVLLGSGTGAVTPMAVLTDGQMIVGDGTTDPVAESGATLRTSIGLGSGITTNYSSVTNFDITVVNGVVTVFTSN